MANITVTTPLAQVKGIFNKVKEAFYLTTPSTPLSSLTKFDVELPLLNDGISFDTGKASITEVKLTTGETWTSMSEAGEASITFQIPSISGAINKIFLNEEGSAITMTNTVEGVSFSAQGYNMEPKKVSGGLFLLAEDRATAIFLPNVEIYASLAVDQSKGAYFDIDVKPLADTSGCSIYILNRTGASPTSLDE
jgi:hypothetical protein